MRNYPASVSLSLPCPNTLSHPATSPGSPVPSCWCCCCWGHDSLLGHFDHNHSLPATILHLLLCAVLPHGPLGPSVDPFGIRILCPSGNHPGWDQASMRAVSFFSQWVWIMAGPEAVHLFVVEASIVPHSNNPLLSTLVLFYLKFVLAAHLSSGRPCSSEPGVDLVDLSEPVRLQNQTTRSNRAVLLKDRSEGGYTTVAAFKVAKTTISCVILRKQDIVIYRIYCLAILNNLGKWWPKIWSFPKTCYVSGETICKKKIHKRYLK